MKIANSEGSSEICNLKFAICNLQFCTGASCRDSWNDFCAAGNTGEPFQPAIGVEREVLVVEAEGGEYRGVQIAERRRPLDGEIADFVGSADALARPDTAAG